MNEPSPSARRRTPSRLVVALTLAACCVATLVPTRATAQSASVAPWPGPEPSGDPSRDSPESAPRREREPRDVQLDVAATTVVPLLIGAQVNVELPLRLQLQGEIGVLPGPYVDAADSLLVGAGAYGDAESTLVRGALRDSLVTRLSGGVRPFDDHGFEIFGGYTMISLGTTVTARDAVESFAGVGLPAGVGSQSVDVAATIHALHATLGWRWVLAEHVVLRTSLGYVHAVGASSSITVPGAVSDVAGGSNVDTATSIAEARLDELLTTYGKLPTVGVSLGFRF